MPALKIGVQLASLRLPLKPALQLAQQLGAAAVEIDARHMLRPEEMSQTALRQFRKLLDDLNLRVCAVAYPTRRGYNVPDDLDRRLAATKNVMKLAQALGAGVVINDVGHVPPGDDTDDWRMLVEVLADLGKFGQHYGAMLAADTGHTGGPALARLLAALPAGSLAVNLNPGRLLVHGHSPSEAVALLGQSIVHVHANDAVRDLARGRGLEVPLGRGSVDFPSLLGALEEQDYRGYFTVTRDDSPDAAFELGQAVKFLRAI